MNKEIQILQQELEQLRAKMEKQERELIIAKLWKDAPNKKCLTISEVADWLGCTVETVRKYEKQGLLLPAYPMAKRKYAYEDVQRFMKGYGPTSGARNKARKQNGV